MNVVAHLFCTVCAASCSIEDDGVVGAAEITTFIGAHSTHERVSVELRLTLPAAVLSENA
jgi:hypothetical protein